ncbi:MAG: hypothetical protein N2Z79_00220 [Candidatus Omnitrophica bacterium]|nr:hypothetical protein [Candidatus Omnitrophota bacterium]
MKNKKGINFIILILTVAVLSLRLRFLILRLIEFNIQQNEQEAQNNLKLISTALGNYAREHLGNYPKNFSDLLKADPAYLDRDYIGNSPIRGYNYSCEITELGFSCSAIPLRCGLSGNRIFKISLGGLTTEECKK